MDAIRGAKISLGVDPLGGAGVHYWGPIAERYGLNLTVVNEAVDPTFRFMTVDWDGQIRMDPSSPYAMQRLIGMKDRFDLSFACDTDHDRHGIVTRSAGLLPPNHYLSVAIFYLFQHRPKWRKEAAVGKTVVSSQMIDRVTAKLGRKLYEVPVGFKWFVDGLLDGSLGFGGEESAGASFFRLDGSVWTTDKDGIIPALLAAEITARMGRDPGEIYRDLTREFGEPVYDRVEAPATPEQKELLAKLSPEQVKLTELAGEKIQTVLTHAPGNGAPIGGLKVMAESGWFAARPSGTENIYKIYAESFRGADHLRRILEEAQTIVSDALRGTAAGDRSGAKVRPRYRSARHRRHHEHTSRASTRPGYRGIRFSRRAGLGHALVVESRDRRSVARSSIPHSGSSRTTPGLCCRRSRATSSSACWPIPRSGRMSMICCETKRQAAEAPAWFQQNASPSSLHLRRVFQHGIHVERSAADLLGRTWQCGRRSAQSRQRSGRAGGRRGAALPARLFSPGDRQGRSTAGPLSRTTTPDSCRSRRCANRTASGCGWRSPCPVIRSGCAPGRSRSAE